MSTQLRAADTIGLALPTGRNADAVASQDRTLAIREWSRLAIASLARILLFAIVGSLMWTAIPTLFGWVSTTVMSDSMAPRIVAGDVVVAMPVDPATVTVGRVVLVDDPDHEGRLRLHRFVSVAADGSLVTRGDANAADDSSTVTRAAVRGVAVLRAPFVGAPFVWATQGRWGLVAAAAAGVLGLLFLSSIDAHLRRARGTGTDAAGRPLRPRRRRAPRLEAALGAAAVASVAVLVLTNGAHASFAAPTPSPVSAFGTSSTFPACWTSTAPADSPSFYYRFSEAPGTAVTDSSTNARAGTLGTGASRSTSACGSTPTPALVLDGTANGQVVTSATAIAAPMTFSLEAWIKTSTTTGGKVIGFGNSASGLSGSYDRHIYMTNAGKLVFGTYSLGVKEITSAASFNDGAWHHVVATMDYGVLGLGSGMKLYVDKVLVGSNANTGSESNSGYWRIGYDNLSGWGSTPTSNGFTGSLDNVAVYTAVLSAAQVTAHFTAGH